MEKRWCSLRDMFSRESRRKLLPSGSGYEPVKEWSLYKPMQFLTPYVAHRRFVSKYYLFAYVDMIAYVDWLFVHYFL